MDKIVKKRRKREGSALGDFEQSKRVACAVINAEREAERRKSEFLKALRLSGNTVEKPTKMATSS